VEEADEDSEEPYEAMWELMAAWEEVTPQLLRINRRKIRLIESNAKCIYLKELPCKGTLRQVFLSV
jgi:hypothetical protein